LTVLAMIASEAAAEWPVYRGLEETLGSAGERAENVSEVWAWLGSYDIARSEAGHLFGEAELNALPVQSQRTVGEINALLGTMSVWSRLSPLQRNALLAGNAALCRRMGRPIRASTVACLVTARRANRGRAPEVDLALTGGVA
jgi:hypothetical protein